jgi:uncharacterized repeat protein (TIGR01451 family)
MGIKKFILYAVSAALIVLGFSGATSAAAVKADYQFQNSLSTSAGTSPPLTDAGTVAGSSFGAELIGGVTRTVWVFPPGSGLVLTPTAGVIPNDRYSILLWFRLSQVDGYRKLIDFRNTIGDAGLYVWDGRLVFYGDTAQVAAGSTAPIAPNTYVQVALTRDGAKNVSGYVNGALQFAFVDSQDRAVISSGNTLRFFRDDNTTQVEHAGGAVARIRLYDDALLPAEIATMQETATPSGGADLGVTASASPNPALPGQNITQTITVTNGGPATAVNATLTLTVPTGATFQSLSAGAGWTCPTVPAAGSSGGSIPCNATNANVGTPAAFSLVTQVPAGTAGGTTLTSAFTVSSATPDTNTANNSVQSAVTVTGAPTATPTATVPPTATVTATATAVPPTATATTAPQPGRWLDKPPTARIPVDYCPAPGEWPILYWGGATGVPIREAAAICSSATTFWIRRGMQWLGYRKDTPGASDNWTATSGEGYFVGTSGR